MGKGWKSGARGGKLVKPVDADSLRLAPSDAEDSKASVDAFARKKYELYQAAVQAPDGDIRMMIRFFREYVGLQVPLALREDFCGTALVCATWCKSDVRRTAVGVDLDRDAMVWGLQTNGDMLGGSADSQMCLLHSNVLHDVSKALRVQLLPQQPAIAAQTQEFAAPPADASEPADANNAAAAAVTEQVSQNGAAEPGDSTEAAAGWPQDLRSQPCHIVCALNFGLCLLHSRQDALQYLRHARAALSDDGSILVLDLLGGSSAECDARIERKNTVTGASFLWEQEGYNPISREIFCHLSLQDQEKMVLPRVWTYHWRLWSIPETRELLQLAGFNDARIWIRPMRQTGQEAAPPAANGKPSSGRGGGGERSGGRKSRGRNSDRGSDRADDAPAVQLQEAEEEEEEFTEWTGPSTFDRMGMQRINRGWTAYVIGVVAKPALD